MNNGDKIRLLDNENLADIFVTVNQSCLKTVLKHFNLTVDEKLLKELRAESKAFWLTFLNKE